MAIKIFRSSRRPKENSIPLGPWQQGVNEKMEPHLLEFSELSDAENIVVDESTGRVRKRPGSIFRSSGFSGILVDSPVRGYNFKRRDGTEFFIITDNKKIAYSLDLDNWVDLTPTAFLSGGEFTGGSFFIDFATAEDRLWVTNGADPVFSWEGAGPMVAYDKATTQITHDAGDTTTDITDVLLDRSADGTTWIGQIVVCTDSVNPENIGQFREISGFDDGTDTISFGGFPVPLINGDKFLVGVDIPRGAYIAYHHNTVFLANSPVNQEEVRFHRQVDPNEPAIRTRIDNPNAWPQENQFEVGSGVGDRIWGFTSPVYRDRIGVFKSSGIYRIDPDPTFRFVPITITEQFGSRFPNSWQQHGEVLMFLGEDTDGRPDVMMTDFATVRHFNRKHARTLDSIRQPSSSIKNRTIASRAEFEAGTNSTSSSGITGRLESREIIRTELDGLLVGEGNTDSLTDPSDPPTVLGHPKWDDLQIADGHNPGDEGWVLQQIGFSAPALVSNGPPNFHFGWQGTQSINGFAGLNELKYLKTLGASVNTQDIFVRVKMQFFDAGNFAPPPFPRTIFSFHNGVKHFSIGLYGTNQLRINGVFIPNPVNHINSFHEYAVLLRSNGTARLWVDNIEQLGLPAMPNTTAKQMQIGVAFVGGGFGVHNFFDFRGEFDYIKYNEDFKASDSLTATLSDTGVVGVVNDFIKPASKFNKHFFTAETGATVDSNESSSSPDNITYSPTLAFPLNGEPGVDNATPSDRYLKTSVAYTITDPQIQPPRLASYQGGILWLSTPIRIGADIQAWDLFQFDKGGSPSSTVIRIRNATSASLGLLTSPDPISEVGWDTARPGSDSEGWIVVDDLDNIGGILGGAEDAPNPPFPETQFLQIKVEFGTQVLGEVHGLANLKMNWLEGTPFILPTSSAIFEKKWMLVGANVNSSINDTIISVDANRAFSNWKDLKINFFTWFKGTLIMGSATDKEILELSSDICQDDDGSDGGSGRNIKAISAFLETKQEIAGEIHNRKKARRLEVACNVQDSTITFSFKRDIDPSFEVLGSVSFSATKNHERLHFRTGNQFKRLIIRAENTILNEDFGLEGMILSIERVPSRSGK